MASNTFIQTQEKARKVTADSRTSSGIRILAKQGHAGRSSTPATGPKQTPKMFLWLMVVAMAAAAVGAVYQPWKLLFPSAAVAGKKSTPALQTVNVVRPSQVADASVVLPATFRPWQTTTLYARVSGYLTVWHKDLGARVKAGELLAEIETPELDQELAEGESLANEATAAAVQAKAELAEARADLKVADAQLVRVQAETELTKSQLVRREKLLAERAVSREDYDTFVTQVQARNADIAAAEADVARRRTNLETRAAIIDAREATAKSRSSNVDRLKELQTFKRIVAPFDGTITHRTAEVGMLVNAGKESLFVVEDMSRVRVQINVPQTYAMQISAGVEAMVSLPESSLPPVEGSITRIADSVDSSTRTMLAEIELENISNHFQPGSYAQVTLVAPQSSAAWTIPTNTVSMRVEGPHIALVNDKDQIEIKHVSLGRDLGNRVVVVEGIRGDERLVVNPGDHLKEGVQIQVNTLSKPVQEIAQR